jgi:hypothetical protein
MANMMTKATITEAVAVATLIVKSSRVLAYTQ